MEIDRPQFHSRVRTIPFQTPYERLGHRNNKFVLRFYLPISRPEGATFERLFVLLNGFGEAKVDVYDELGDALAQYGVASVLLPLPNHFCRWSLEAGDDTWQEYVGANGDPYRFTAQVKYGLVTENLKSRLLEQRHVLLGGFRQLLEDVDRLTRLVKRTKIDVDTEEFFEQNFSSNTRVSLYGYSLGGLLALASLLHQPDQFDCCIVVNSGASIQDIGVPRLVFDQPADWERVQRNAYEDFKEKGRTVLGELEDIYSWIFLGNNRIVLKDKLKEHYHRLLYILGARDQVFLRGQVMQAEPQETGLAMLQVPVLGHWIGAEDRPAWEVWKSFIVRTILAFEEDHQKDVPHLLDILRAKVLQLAPSPERLAGRVLLYQDDGMLREEWATSNLGDPGRVIGDRGGSLEGALCRHYFVGGRPVWFWDVVDLEDPERLAQLGCRVADAEMALTQGLRTVGVAPLLVGSPARAVGCVALYSDHLQPESVLSSPAVQDEMLTASVSLGYVATSGKAPGAVAPALHSSRSRKQGGGGARV